MGGPRRSSFGQLITLLVTNAIKLAGLVIALKATFTSPQPSALALAEAAFMMAGAQLSEEVVIRLVQRMFTPSEATHPQHDPPAVPPAHHHEIPKG